MHISSVLAITGLVSTVLSSTVELPKRAVSTTCKLLKARYPNITYAPADSGYQAENEVPWNQGAWLSPACIITPTNAAEVSNTVQLLSLTRTAFAMRGGGHMFIPTAANIGSTGVLISSTKLTTLSLSADLQTLSVGPGPRWGDVYVYLASTGTGKMVVGGRYSPVGVPGLLLGGGISFYSNEFGFASSNGNIRAIECVLASGQIVTATSNNLYADLFWALLGGGNSFAIVTRFDLRTFDSPVQMIADAHYGTGATTKSLWMDSILNNCLSGSTDVKGAVIPVARLGHGAAVADITYDNLMFYNGNASTPVIFKDFQGGLLPAGNSTTLQPIGLARFSQAVAPAFKPGGESHDLQQMFHVTSTKASKEAMEIVHDIYFAAMEELVHLEGFFTGLAYLAITTSFTTASNTGVGCPQGLANEPVFWIEEAVTWKNAADSALINSVLDKANAEIVKTLGEKDLLSKYIYLNDADAKQKVFESYPKENLVRLKSIRSKYDSARVYTDLMKGGFKVDKAALV